MHIVVDVEGMVRKFMDKHELPRFKRPGVIPPEHALARIRLMNEELAEVITAIHELQVLSKIPDRPRDIEEILNENLEAMTLLADGLADLVYVVVGTAIAYGIPFNDVFAEVQRSNMTKASLDPNDKGGKGPEFEEPKIREILEAKLA
jgi:predicted HAD superfamily Cof-like phosphohydrolase